MNLQHLYYFQTLAKLQHFAKSAAELYITQPSLSYAITSLEKELNVKLFDRNSRFSRLTPAGEVFLEHVNRSLIELEKGKAAVKTYERADSSFIRIVTEKTFIMSVILNAFKDEETYKSVGIQMTQSLGSSIYDQLRLGNFDFALSASHPASNEFEFFELLDLPLVLLVPGDHPLSSQNSINLDQVDWTQPIIVRTERNSITVRRINSIYKMVGFDIAKAACHVKSSLALATLVELGLGIGISAYFPQLDAFSNIKPLKINGPAVSGTLYFSRMANVPHSQNCELFYSYVKEHYAK